jgi:hypothetical protein
MHIQVQLVVLHLRVVCVYVYVLPTLLQGELFYLSPGVALTMQIIGVCISSNTNDS